MKQDFFRTPFLVPPSCEVSSASLQGCSDTQVDADFAAASVSTKATIRPEEPVCRSATTTSSVCTPAASLLAHRHRAFSLTTSLRGDVMTYAKVLFK